MFLCSRGSSNSLKNLPCPREVARSGFAMLLLLGLCLGLPLFSESQEDAWSWDDTSEQVSRRKSCGSQRLCPFPSSPWAIWLLDRLELIRSVQGRGRGIAFLWVCTISFPSLQHGDLPICWSLVPLLSGPQRLPRSRFPQSCTWNFKVVQNQMFLLASAAYQIPIRPYENF